MLPPEASCRTRVACSPQRSTGAGLLLLALAEKNRATEAAPRRENAGREGHGGQREPTQHHGA
jgi:hypothetical protein